MRARASSNAHSSARELEPIATLAEIAAARQMSPTRQPPQISGK